MACFLVPAAEAVITTVAARVVKSKELGGPNTLAAPEERDGYVSFSTKLGWLNKMLWGGSALLAFEHVWHGEIVPTFPFLTAVAHGEGASMLAEMSSTGVMMAAVVTAAWGLIVALSSRAQRGAKAAPHAAIEGSPA